MSKIKSIPGSSYKVASLPVSKSAVGGLNWMLTLDT